MHRSEEKKPLAAVYRMLRLVQAILVLVKCINLILSLQVASEVVAEQEPVIGLAHVVDIVHKVLQISHMLEHPS